MQWRISEGKKKMGVSLRESEKASLKKGHYYFSIVFFPFTIFFSSAPLSNKNSVWCWIVKKIVKTQYYSSSLNIYQVLSYAVYVSLISLVKSLNKLSVVVQIVQIK